MEVIETMIAPMLDTLIPVIGASGFATAASAAGTVAGSVAIAASFGAAGAGLTVEESKTFAKIRPHDWLQQKARGLVATENLSSSYSNGPRVGYSKGCSIKEISSFNSVLFCFSSSTMKMADDICFLHKDTLIIKAPKRSPLALRMVVLLFVMVCGVYIFSTCFNQISPDKTAKLRNIQSIDQLCPAISQSQNPYLHYPKPLTFSREECACNPVQPFVILSMQRSGSGWFETLLNSHINVSSNGEIFGEKERRSNASVILKTLDNIYNLDWLSSSSKNECLGAVGLKWMLNQGVMVYHEEIAEYFRQKGVSVIFLFRRNLLRRMVSMLANSYDKHAKLLNGTHKSHVHSPFEAQILAGYKPSINITVLKPTLKSEEENIARAMVYFKSTNHIVLYYEDLVKNSTKLRNVQEFLNLPYRNLTSRQVKIHTRPLSKQIENWDGVEKELKGTAYESFLVADY
ncbi:hypothetical protein Nepgr_015685 [Nepenthes gracilis]|uniref:Sulfotransferase n=1 Tax=Nepenthes gracilis TaxID=150966 RepID=A0AAD3XRB9_NEPGR|nr:hypothetical protein Nepgr_015685 [Nepenthes gracilis]